MKDVIIQRKPGKKKSLLKGIADKITPTELAQALNSIFFTG